MSGYDFVSMTYNVWGDHRLAERLPALRELCQVRDPDLLAVQELRPDSRAAIDAALPGHERVDSDFPGWQRQCNLWWRRDRFTLLASGAEDVGIWAEHARLFWVRLRPAGGAGEPLLFSTAHLTWPGHPQERADDRSPRVAQARAVVGALDRLAPDGPCVFTVDINDYARPLWVLREAGFRDSFAALGASSPVTHPALPLVGVDQEGPQWPPVAKAIDWQFHRGPLRPRCSEVVEYFHHGRPPSDHKPVVVAYTVRGSGQAGWAGDD